MSVYKDSKGIGVPIRLLGAVVIALAAASIVLTIAGTQFNWFSNVKSGFEVSLFG